MNHDCAPNVEVVPNGENGEVIAVEDDDSSVKLRLLRSVKKGERLTINYCPTTYPLEKRKKWLSHWFFECRCARCEREQVMEFMLKGESPEGKRAKVEEN